MDGSKGLQALMLVTVMFLAPLSGCFGENMDERVSSENDVVVTPQTLSGGVFQGLTVAAEKDLSVFIPYLILMFLFRSQIKNLLSKLFAKKA